MKEIKDILYTSKKAGIDLFNEAKTGIVLDLAGLKQLLSKYSKGALTDE